MLRITRSIEGNSVLLKLEGKLLAPWTAAVLAELRGHDAAREVRLDLHDVSFVDAAGLVMLHDLILRGAVIARCSSFVAELLHAEKP